MTHLLQFPILPTPCSSSSTTTSHFFAKPITGITSTVQIRPSRSSYRVPQPQRMNSIKCMANPRRVAMVAKQIRRELSDMLLTDKILQNAVLPETALGADLYLSSVTTITDVEVSTDLQEVKVYVSIFGDERGREVALSGLISKAKYVRSQLGKRMKLRLTPQVRFVEDDSLERGSRVLAILDRIKKENEQKDGGSPGDEEETSDLPTGDDEDWEGEYPDEDIIYVR